MEPEDELPEDDWSAALLEQGAEGGDTSLAEEWGAALAEQGTTRNAGDVAAEWATMIEDGESDNLPELAGNDRVLNQDEIDGVLGFSMRELSASGAGGVQAIVDSGVVQYERLPMLEIVFDRMIRLLSTSLRNLFQDNVEVTLDNITSVRFGDYLNAIPLPTLLGVFRAEQWENSGLVTVDSNLAYATFDLLLGGKRGGSSSRLDGRPFTAIEMTLVRRLVEIVLGDLEMSFQPLSPVSFGIDRIETNPRFATITRPGNAAILISLRLDVDGRGGMLQILFPYATIEPIRELLTQSFMGEKLGRDHVWEGHLATEIWQADVTMDAVLHEMMLPLKQVMSLKVGETLMFDAKPSDLITVRCGDWALTQGRIGRVDGHIAVQVTRPLRRSRTTIQAYEASMNNRSDS
ncbi:flagellar motor switch protein FliM [Methylobacterium sp. PvP062]|jgi:flagellar motor switch protein FliM|uniref:Flagellar motor switch protein FliM n=4 Tax=Methylobacteriaceae TaxID=119045 RepID=B1LYK3_METRJ|nr:flagellar motor switch protein FliM [Methylobacterium radiotolerans JCM 2831]KIU36772.1 flagellar motor switch protein FliM [Methylobacterium radiotolerans]MBP2493291.1 flagellar motor switch protein FliM [Methylobacterium sp. PvP105]MBP2500336.1 flagellar motor switch protein FliM [Methylobacterium sp. PvP109]PVY97239.1 flagellar motor switch protein FliM [Methylobacterium organophilum]GAN50189.1 flagellar motor switch protein FliM [Methylobacterium sp. ME121]